MYHILSFIDAVIQVGLFFGVEVEEGVYLLKGPPGLETPIGVVGAENLMTSETISAILRRLVGGDAKKAEAVWQKVVKPALSRVDADPHACSALSLACLSTSERIVTEVLLMWTDHTCYFLKLHRYDAIIRDHDRLVRRIGGFRYR